MNNLADIRIEMLARRRGEQSETEWEQRARLYTLFRSPVAEESGIQQIAVRMGALVAALGDRVTGLRCQLESRFATEPRATAC